MTAFGYHASHEQHTPRALLDYVQRAERAGFERAMCSDHFHPWTEAQGQSGFAWSWLGSALQATSLSFGTVCAPGWRYNPAIIAQAAATLAQMYPARFWLAAGSGEALNEGITGDEWPAKSERNARLRECVDILRALWRGETVTHRGRITVLDAKLYTRPSTPPLLAGAALTPATAAFVGQWADALITTGGDADALLRMREAFARGGGAGKPLFVQHVLSWADSENEARAAAHEQWRFSALGSDVLPILRTPAQFDAATRFVQVEDVLEGVRTSASLEQHAEWLHAYVEAGVDAVYLMNVNRSNQLQFIEAFGERVLPRLRG